MFEKLVQFSGSALAKVKLSSALNPILWLVGITMPFGFLGLFAFTGIAQAVCIVVLLVPLLTGCFSYVYFAIQDPGKLRSEQFELKQAALSLIKEKGSDIAVDTMSIEAVANLSYDSEKETKLLEHSQ